MSSNRFSRLAALVAVLTAPIAAAQDTYGSGHISLYRVGFSEFVPADSGLTYSDRIVVTNGYARYPTTTSFFPFVAIPHLPAGALVSSVEFDWCDKNAVDDANFYVETTSYTGENDTILSTTSSNGSAGCEFSTAVLGTPYTVDNNLSQLVLSAYLPDTDGSLAIAGAIIHYTLQVSSSPATATFSDVPTTHPFFQFVEALAASGITAGCAPGKFCPNDPVTRGQMAVFLARALGLEFP